MTLRVAVTGASGRMGQAVARAVIADDNAELVAFVARPGSVLSGTNSQSLLGSDSPSLEITETLSFESVDVVIDFTLPDSTLANAKLCADAGVPIVIGTTGFSDDQLIELDAGLASVASCRAANFSTGVNLAYRLLAIAAEVMGADADIEIHEAHHKHKIDAPSGTALAMGQAITDAMGTSLSEVAQYDRSAVREAREPGSIGFSVTRSGDIVGEHTVMFGTKGERLEITHKASSRNAFAAGALRAAHFLRDKPAGSYSMADVLGLS